MTTAQTEALRFALQNNTTRFIKMVDRNETNSPYPVFSVVGETSYTLWDAVEMANNYFKRQNIMQDHYLA